MNPRYLAFILKSINSGQFFPTGDQARQAVEVALQNGYIVPAQTGYKVTMSGYDFYQDFLYT